MPQVLTSHWRSVPCVRNTKGVPVTSNVSTINRSDVIRRMFVAAGKNLSNSRIHTQLANEGLRVSDTLINSQRRQLLAEKLIKAE